MATPVFHLNPDFPLVWQDPSTLQIGVDPPLVILQSVPDDLLPLLHHLSAGISQSGLAMFARLHGVSPERTRALVEALEPALGPSEPASPLPFVLDGPKDLLGPSTRVLTDLGHAVVHADHTGITDPGKSAGEVLVLGHFVPHPLSFHRWLRLDRPHTPIIFSDQAVTVGPRISPGHTPCLTCALRRAGQNPRTASALASQLWGRIAPRAFASMIRLGTWHAHQLVVGKSTGYRIRIAEGAGVPEVVELSPTPGCGCLGLPEG